MNAFDRLNAADPGQAPDDITLARMRRRVLRTRRFNPMSVAATVTAFALVAGGGVAVGRVTAPSNSSAIAAADLSSTPGIAPSRASAAGEDAAKSYFPGWGGRVILNPSASMSDSGGVAVGFGFTSIEGVDKSSVLRTLADLIGASGDITVMGRGDESMTIGNSTDGSKPVAAIYQDQMLSFYAYNNERSPWNCVRQEEIDSSTKPGAYPPDVRVCTDEDSKPASKAEAERIFARVLAALGIKASEVSEVQVDTGSPQVIMIQGNAKVGGTETNMQRLAVSVSAKGLFNISGIAAKPVQFDGYEIVGAKTAALRSQWSKWSALGPNPFGDWGVYPMERDVISERSMTLPPSFMVDGKPGITTYLQTIDVSKARLGLVTYYADNGSTLLLPAWVYTADDGREWSMIALADKYVKFGN
jgi:hypothetical protein